MGEHGLRGVIDPLVRLTIRCLPRPQARDALFRVLRDRLGWQATISGELESPASVPYSREELPASAGQLPAKNPPRRTPRKDRPAMIAGLSAGPAAGSR
jgi:hypothetical protein